MSGTPIENHLGELWSIFEFLNPGMLGSDRSSRRIPPAAVRSTTSDRDLAGQGPAAVHPPPHQGSRSSRTCPRRPSRPCYCDLEAEQRQVLRRAAGPLPRRALLRKDTAELNRSKIEVLEALLAAAPGGLPPRPDRPGR